MMGDRASGGTAAVTCGVRCHPQLFTPGSQVPQRPRGNRGTGEASQPGGRQGSLEPPLHSQRGRQSLSARPPGELRPSPRPEAGPSSAPASKGPPCGLQPPPGRQRSGALQVVAQPPAQIRKGSPSLADGDAPHLPRTPPGGSPALPLRQLDLGRRTPGLRLGQDVRRRHWPGPRSPGRRRPRCPSSQRSLALGVTSPGVHAPLPLSLFCGVPTCGSLRRGPGTSRPRPRPCPRLDTASQVRAAGLAEALPVKPQACLGHAGPCRQAGRPEGAAVAGSTDGVKS